MPKISIIMPVYNKGDFLDRAIESILKQSVQDFELILINDGSTDHSARILEHYGDAHPTKIRCFSQRNKGVSATRNYGMALAKGDYISFLDADDGYHPDFLKECLAQVQYKNSDVILTMHEKHFLGTNQRVHSKMNRKSKMVLKDFILGKIDANTNSWLIKKSLVMENGIQFKEEMTYGEDMLFFIEVLLHASHSSCVAKALTTYHIGVEDSLSTNSIDKVYKDIEWITMAIQLINEQNMDASMKSILIDALQGYRLPAAIVYRLHLNRQVVDYHVHKENVMRHIKKFRFNNGLRSMKLFKYMKQL